MVVKIKKINNVKVKALKYPDEDNRPIKGGDIIPIWSPNIFLVSKKNSGKTVTIETIIRKCCGKNTIVMLFVSTLYNDKCWKYIRKMLKDNNIEVKEFTSINEEGDQLELLANQLKNEAKEKELEKELADEKKLVPKIQKQKLILCDDDSDSESDEDQIKKKSKYRYPDYVIVYDDLSTELKSKSIASLLKKNRHTSIMNIISSQWVHDMEPAELKQIDIWIVFRGQPKKKLLKIYDDAQISIEFDEFYKLYKIATREKYSFFYINTQDQEFRHNFDKKLILSEDI